MPIPSPTPAPDKADVKMDMVWVEEVCRVCSLSVTCWSLTYVSSAWSAAKTPKFTHVLTRTHGRTSLVANTIRLTNTSRTSNSPSPLACPRDCPNEARPGDRASAEYADHEQIVKHDRFRLPEWTEERARRTHVESFLVMCRVRRECRYLLRYYRPCYRRDVCVRAHEHTVERTSATYVIHQTRGTLGKSTCLGGTLGSNAQWYMIQFLTFRSITHCQWVSLPAREVNVL